MPECKKYLRRGPQETSPGDHFFLAVYMTDGGEFTLYVASGQVDCIPQDGALVTFPSFAAALSAVDGHIEQLTMRYGFTVAWESMDSNANAVPWLEAKSRKFRTPEIVEPAWFCVAPMRTPTYAVSAETRGDDLSYKKVQSAPLHLLRRKAPWNF